MHSPSVDPSIAVASCHGERILTIPIVYHRDSALRAVRLEPSLGGGYVVEAALQEEVAAVEQHDLRVQGVAPERFRAWACSQDSGPRGAPCS